MKPFFAKTAKFSASESFCDSCYRIFQVVIAVFCRKKILCMPLPFPEMLISHPENSSFTTYGYGKCKPRDIAIPIAVPRDIYIVRSYFRLFAFFLAPLIICDTKGICQIRERGRPSLMDQPLAERLCQNIYILYLELLSSMNYEHSRI